MSDEPTVRRRKLSDYTLDSANPNKGSERGQTMIADSLAAVGTGRSLVADGTDTLVAGNQVAKAALTKGLTDVIEVETDGDALIVHKRRNLTGEQARQYAYLDNQSQRVSLVFDVDVINADIEAGFDFSGIFRLDELDDLQAEAAVEAQVESAVGEPRNRLTGGRAKQIKPVLYAEDIVTFEQALRATGLTNRGQALVEVCRVYLEHTHENAAPLEQLKGPDGLAQLDA